MKNLYDESIMWGTHGSVKNIDDKICKKVYQDYTLTTIKDHVIDRWVFNTIKDLDLDSFVKLYNYTFDSNKMQIISYTMEYYKPYFDNILNISVEYFLDSFKKIYNDIIILSYNKILVGDMNFSNVIFGENGIKVIDFDNYMRSSLSNEMLIKLNIIELCRCFKGVYRNALYDVLLFKSIPRSIRMTMNLFDPEVDDLPSHVTKKLIKYSNLCDYFEDEDV